MENEYRQLNVALIEPEIPQNTGNIARTCAATGARLHLVGPMGFEITERRVRRAGLDYWDKLDITYYGSTAEFFEKNKGASFYYFSTKARRAHSDTEYEKVDICMQKAQQYNMLLDNISLYLEFMTDKHINYKDDDLPF